MTEELVEAKILDYGKIKELHKSILFAREYSRVVKGGPPPIDIPKELYYQMLSTGDIKYGPLDIIPLGDKKYKIKGLNAIISTDKEGTPLYAIINFSDSIRVYLAYEKPKSVIGIDIGVRHVITLVALRNGKLWKVRFWGNEELVEEMVKILGDPQGISEIKNLRLRIRRIVSDVIKFINELNPKIVAIEDLRVFETKAGKALKVIEDELEENLYKTGVKYKRLMPYNTSKICSNCGFKKGEVMGPLFVCPACGYKADRDFNAAYNLALQCYYTC
jgi:transposase